MVFSKVKAAGWTNDTNTVTAAELNALDLNQSQAVDGAAGGTYTPSAAVEINGSGLSSSNIQDSTVTGTVQRSAAGRLPRLVDVTTITNVAGFQLVDMASDVYKADAAGAHAQNLNIRLAVSSGQTPVTGDTIEIVREGPSGGAATFQIFSEDAPAAQIAAFPVGVAVLQASDVYSAKFFYNGATWKRLRFSADVFP